MKKFLLFIFVSMILIGCSSETTTTSVSTTTEASINTSIGVPVLEIIDNVIVWNAVDNADSYEVYIRDVTPNAGDLLVADEHVNVNEPQYPISELVHNREVYVSVRTIIGEEHSEFSVGLTIANYIDSGVSYDYPLVAGSTHDYVVFPEPVPTIFSIEYRNEESSTDTVTVFDFIPSNAYYIEYDRLYIMRAYFSFVEDDLELYLFTEDGIMMINLIPSNENRPFIVSNNELTFVDEDIVLVFELCGGTFVELSGSDIGTSDYVLDDNVLVIEKEFIADLFDENPERSSVILSYQLRNGDEIVIGYVFINRN